MKRGLIVIVGFLSLHCGGKETKVPHSPRVVSVRSAVDDIDLLSYRDEKLTKVVESQGLTDVNQYFFTYDDERLVEARIDNDVTVKIGWEHERPAKFTVDGVTITYLYANGRVVGATGVDAVTVTYVDDHLATVEGSGGMTSFNYVDGLLGSIAEGSATTTFTYTDGRLSRAVSGAVVDDITYSNGLIQTITRTGGGPQRVLTYDYERDAEMVGIAAAPATLGGFMFGLDGKPRTTIELLALDVSAEEFTFGWLE